MASWREVRAAAPELADAVQRCFDAHKHKTMATIRPDGGPRISGNEANFTADEIWLGMMPGSVRARDLARDPRIALHSATVDEEMKQGDAKVSGRALAVTDPAEFTRLAGDEGEPGTFDLFKIDVTEMVHIWVAGDRLIVDSWREGRGTARAERT